MAVNRIGFSSDFTLKNQKVGVGSADPTATLDVRGAIKGDFNVSGVTTLTSYGGFAPQKQFVNENLTLTGDYNTVSEDIIVGLGKTFTVSAGSSVSIGTLKNVSIGTHFSVPNGGTSARTDSPVEGMVRFNDDLNTLEFWNGYEWRQFNVTGASGRGVFGGGGNPSFSGFTNNIDYVNISTTGNALNFGTLSTSNRHPSGCSSSIRGVIYLGYIPAGFTNVIEYFTIASEGNSIDFGDLNSDYRYSSTSCSSSTRGLIGGGYGPSSFNNTINYIEISTLGNSLDFGDLTSARSSAAALSSPTRGLFAGGNTPIYTNTIDTVTIASTGNAVSFGSLIATRGSIAGCSNGTRGVFGGGYFYTSPSSIISYNVSEYVTIASNGNSTYFGDLTFSGGYRGATSSRTRGVFAGGTGSINVIDYVTIATTGNALDFGDLTLGRYNNAACSDSHGGLGGF